MEIQLIIVSKLCSEIIATKTIKLNPDSRRTPEDIYQAIYEISHLPEDQYQIFWRYSISKFHTIDDYFSYMAALNTMAENKIYLLLKDYEEPWKDNIRYLEVLDQVELRLEMERNRDIYDVKIKRQGDPDSDEEDERMLKEADDFVPDFCRTDSEVLEYAMWKMPQPFYYTDDFCQNTQLIRDVQQETASLLCFANILGMKGEIISCPHKDIYFLETNTKSESTDLANLFASPAGREMVKYKPRTKLKHKLNPALEFFIQNKATKTVPQEIKPIQEESKSCARSISQPERTSRRNSIDLYEEAATILGLTCSQTDDCKCIECQCHYFDFEEEIDFPAGSECVVDHSSSCSIQ